MSIFELKSLFWTVVISNCRKSLEKNKFCQSLEVSSSTLQSDENVVHSCLLRELKWNKQTLSFRLPSLRLAVKVAFFSSHHFQELVSRRHNSIINTYFYEN